jgi:hypothetical protein
MNPNKFSPFFTIACAVFGVIALVLSDAVLALSVSDFEAKPSKESAALLGKYIQQAVERIYAQDHSRGLAVRDYIYNNPLGKDMTQGVTDFYAMLDYVEELGKKGKLDLSKITIEAIVDEVIDQKFPPHPTPQAASTTASSSASPSPSSTPSPSPKP